ncbi:zinc-binding dehydrogenase [Herbiconiux sp. KACC 21604]|uniref:zinc-dependent alcohol dehydrogenase n=1 Tax=unclassified Herbiconiux TaxID=2618217 RepID=UPI001491251F|nr:zinc-binding dehydrogenase [Herbiconiux sp. SALV-R1]QJU54930.1 zinc-binding dehydrogenase [Herbiconiux sp. SALV-R1]WPO86055.1 zinc-binding dehydrogenase [Herbiconiux sp. KACC 21604]
MTGDRVLGEGSGHVGAVIVDRDPTGAVGVSYGSRPRPVPGEGELLVRPAYVGICGSDLEQLHGGMPESFVIAYPHVLGHEWAGEVVEVGPGASRFSVGDRVLGHGDLGGNAWFGVTHDGAMAELFAVAESMCFAVPASVDLKTAAIIEPFVCVYTALQRVGGVTAADTVHVHGLGAIGLSAVIQAATAGAEVVVFDPSPPRRALALSLGAVLAVDPLGVGEDARVGGAPDEQPLDVVERETGRRLADLVVEASGAPSAQAAALESADDRGRVLLMGVSVPRAAPTRLGLVQQRGLTVSSSTGAPPEYWAPAIRFVERRGIDLSVLVSSTLDFADITEAVRRAEDSRAEIKVLVRPSASPTTTAENGD